MIWLLLLGLQAFADPPTIFKVETTYAAKNSFISLLKNAGSYSVEITPDREKSKTISIDAKNQSKILKRFQDLHALASHDVKFCDRFFLQITEVKSQSKKTFCLRSQTPQGKRANRFLSYFEVLYRATK